MVWYDQCENKDRSYLTFFIYRPQKNNKPDSSFLSTIHLSHPVNADCRIHYLVSLLRSQLSMVTLNKFIFYIFLNEVCFNFQPPPFPTKKNYLPAHAYTGMH